MEEVPHALQSNAPIIGEPKSNKKEGNEEILKAMKRLEDKNQRLEKLCAEKSELSEVTQLALDYVRLLCKDLHDKCAQVTGSEELKQKRFLPGKLLQEKESQLKRVLAEKMAERKKTLEEKQYERNPDSYLKQTLQSQSENAFKLSQQLSKLNKGGDEVWNVMMTLEKTNQSLRLQKSLMEEKLNELTKIRAEETGLLKAFQNENENLKHIIQQLQNQQQKQQSTSDDELNRLKAKYFDEKQTTENERKCLQQAKDSIEEELRQAIEAKNLTENKLSELREKYDSLKETCNQIEGLISEKEKLEDNVTRLQVLQEEKEELVTILLNEKKNLEKQKEAVEKDKKALKSNLYDLQSEIKKLDDDLQSREKRISKLEEDLEKVSKMKEDLKKERDSLEKMKQELEQNLYEITEKNNKLEKMSAKLSKEKKDSESQRDSYEKKLHNITEENRKLKEKCEKLCQAIATQDMCKLIERLQSENKAQNQKIEELEDKTNSMQP